MVCVWRQFKELDSFFAVLVGWFDPNFLVVFLLVEFRGRLSQSKGGGYPQDGLKH